MWVAVCGLLCVGYPRDDNQVTDYSNVCCTCSVSVCTQGINVYAQGIDADQEDSSSSSSSSSSSDDSIGEVGDADEFVFQVKLYDPADIIGATALRYASMCMTDIVALQLDMVA